MIELRVDPRELEAILTAGGAPRYRAARCSVSDALDLRIEGLVLGKEVVGVALPAIDVGVRLWAERLDDHTVRVRFELGKIAGLPALASRLVPRRLLAAKLVDTLAERLGRPGCAEHESDGSVRVRLDQLGRPDRPWPAALRCAELRVPGRDGAALHARFESG